MEDRAGEAEDHVSDQVREHGRIRRVFDNGFGFVQPDSDPGAQGIFFHATDLLSGPFDRLVAGIGVTYVLVQEKEGPRATQVIEDGKEEVPPEERKRGERAG